MLKYNWTRVQYPNGGYGYVKTDNNDQAIEYKRDGTFKVYSQPNEKSHSFYTSFETKPRTIQRAPDDHEAHLAQQKQVDKKVRQVTPSAEQLFNIATVGGLNNLSPTQWMRRAYDTGQLIQGYMPLNEYMNKLYYGNNGIVSDEYARKHPYRTMATNLAGDIATFGAASTLRKMPSWYRTMQAENQAVRNTVANNWRNIGRNAKTTSYEQPTGIIRRMPFNFNFKTAKKDLYEIYPKINEPFIYDEFGEFIPNRNYYYRRGWGIIDDAVETGKIRVPEGDYKSEALKKYPWLDNGNPFSTALMNHKFPYFSEGELWDQTGKFGRVPDDLIAVPKETPGVKWVAGSKWGKLLKNKKPSEVGGRATPLINGEPNSLPTSKATLFKYNNTIQKYEPYLPDIKNTPIYTERPSTLSEAERLGIPKSERNNIRVSEQFIHPVEAVRPGRQYIKPTTKRVSITTSEPLMGNSVETLQVPEGYTIIKQLQLRTKDGFRTVHKIRNNKTGKFGILEDYQKNISPKVDLKKYHGEKLTGNEEGFDEWALSRSPETDHFANLSHGLNNEKLLPIMNREFEALPNGSRVDLGEIFSSDSSSNILQYVRRNNKRIKMILPKNPDEMVVSNEYGTRGVESERIFNEQLEKLLDLYGYSPNAVPKAVYNQSTNTLTVPKLSFIKLYKQGNKLSKYSLYNKNYGINV